MHIFNAGGSARWGPVPFMKKSLVTAVQSFNHVLKCLRTHITQVPIGYTFLEFRQMLLEGVFRHRFSVKPVEPPCESHAMVPRQCTGIDLSVQFLIALRRKELVFVGSHVRDDTAIFRSFEHNNLDALYPLPEGTGFTARVIRTLHGEDPNRIRLRSMRRYRC